MANMVLPRMMAYYGSKWRIANRYPEPRFDTIVEPFAGGAGYSLHYPELNVLLYDTNEIVCSVWDYLIRATQSEIMDLPLLEEGQSTEGLNVIQEAKWLIGFWVNNAVCAPRKSLSKWAIESIRESDGKCVNFWSAGCRDRLAAAVTHISHWKVKCADYRECPDIEATWFVDPPYVGMGHYYMKAGKTVDYEALAEWCGVRRGQTMVCELEGAAWLPFGPLLQTVNARKKARNEVIWLNDRD